MIVTPDSFCHPSAADAYRPTMSRGRRRPKTDPTEDADPEVPCSVRRYLCPRNCMTPSTGRSPKCEPAGLAETAILATGVSSPSSGCDQNRCRDRNRSDGACVAHRDSHPEVGHDCRSLHAPPHQPWFQGSANPPTPASTAISDWARTAGSLSGSCRAPGCRPSWYSPSFPRHLAGTRLDTARIVVRTHWRTTDRARTSRSAEPLRKRRAGSPNRGMLFASITPTASKYLVDVAVPSRDRRQHLVCRSLEQDLVQRTQDRLAHGAPSNPRRNPRSQTRRRRRGRPR